MVMAFCQVARGAAVSILLATERTKTLSLLSLSGGLGLALALVLVHWWHQFEVVLIGLLQVTSFRSPCFVSLPRLASDCDDWRLSRTSEALCACS